MLRFIFFLGVMSALSAEVSTRELQFENEKVKVWKTKIPPSKALKMHRHDRDRVVVGLHGGKLVKVEETGEVSELSFATHKAYWLEKDPIDMLHADLNEGEKTIEVMVIELKDS